jgi:hypothetical protein
MLALGCHLKIEAGSCLLISAQWVRTTAGNEKCFKNRQPSDKSIHQSIITICIVFPRTAFESALQNRMKLCEEPTQNSYQFIY